MIAFVDWVVGQINPFSNFNIWCRKSAIRYLAFFGKFERINLES
jgi:hypothetical protein